MFFNIFRGGGQIIAQRCVGGVSIGPILTRALSPAHTLNPSVLLMLVRKMNVIVIWRKALCYCFPLQHSFKCQRIGFLCLPSSIISMADASVCFFFLLSPLHLYTWYDSSAYSPTGMGNKVQQFPQCPRENYSNIFIATVLDWFKAIHPLRCVKNHCDVKNNWHVNCSLQQTSVSQLNLQTNGAQH